MKKTALIAATLVVILTACGGKSAEAANIFVSVTITNDKIDVPIPDPVPVHGQGHVIHWEIKTPGYVFADAGIVIHDDTANEFDGGHTAEQGKKFQLNDKNSFRKAYKYTVNVMKGSTPLTPLDPSIAND